MSLRATPRSLASFKIHAALRRAAARQLKQVIARKDELVAFSPVPRDDKIAHLLQKRLFLFKEQLDDRQIHLAEVLDLSVFARVRCSWLRV